MIVCSCKAVCSKRLDTIIANGASTVEDIGRACGAGTDCGSCLDQLEGLLEEAAQQVTSADDRKHLPLASPRAA